MSIENASDRKAAQQAAVTFLEEVEELDRLMAEKVENKKAGHWYDPPGLKRARGRVRRASHALSEALVDLRRY